MILLAHECLVFRTSDGEGIPCTAEMISVELMGDVDALFDPEFIRNAAAAVFHYFRDDLGRGSVTVAEFSDALEKVLHGFKLPLAAKEPAEDEPPQMIQLDLRLLASDSGSACELFFFPRLRDELRAQLRRSPQTLCFQGLRPCVKRLAGARRWSARCQVLGDRIVDYVRACLHQDFAECNCAIIVK